MTYPLLQDIGCFAQFFWQTSSSLIQYIEKIIGVDELVLIQAHCIVDQMLKQIQVFVNG